MTKTDLSLAQWRRAALDMQMQMGKVVLGQQSAIRLLVIAAFARGHLLLEGDVGVGKTTLLRAYSRAIGGTVERVEGTVDLMPSDLIYHTYVDPQGKPRVDPGPLLRHGEGLSVFFFNEINRARPQVHSLMLRVMAERTVSAFDRTYFFPHVQVIADRNRVERDETYEIPAAARDRFLMEFNIEMPADREMQRELMFSTRFHDVDRLIDSNVQNAVPYAQLNDIATQIQDSVSASETLERYALDLAEATRQPEKYGIQLVDDNEPLVQSGMSPRGMSMLMRAARVNAWLEERETLLPQDIHAVFHPCVGHRIFLKPVYEMRRDVIIPLLTTEILNRVTVP